MRRRYRPGRRRQHAQLVLLDTLRAESGEAHVTGALASLLAPEDTRALADARDYCINDTTAQHGYLLRELPRRVLIKSTMLRTLRKSPRLPDPASTALFAAPAL